MSSYMWNKDFTAKAQRTQRNEIRSGIAAMSGHCICFALLAPSRFNFFEVSQRMEIRGIIPPVATPMQDNEDLDLPRLKSFIDHLLAAGVHGIFVLGTNSDFYAMDDDEKQRVFATAVEHVRGRAPVFAGTGAESTREAVRLTKMAEREGVQGVSVITPYFVIPNQQELADHYRRV